MCAQPTRKRSIIYEGTGDWGPMLMLMSGHGADIATVEGGMNPNPDYSFDSRIGCAWRILRESGKCEAAEI